MDFGNVAIGGVGVLVLVLGIVEACKRFGVEGKASFALALALGFAFVAVSSGIEQELIPASAVPYIELVVKGLGGALAATGMYDIVRKMQPK